MDDDQEHEDVTGDQENTGGSSTYGHNTGVDPNDVLFPSSVPTAKFDQIGDTVEGTILDVVSQQQTDIKTGDLLFWKDRRPRMQLVVTLLTKENDPDIEDDDGRRRLFVKADMMRAVREAITHAGKRKIKVGAHLAVRYASDGIAPQKGLSKPKVYQAVYTPHEEPFPDN